MFQSVTSAVYFVLVLILSISGTFGNICALVAVAKSPILRKRNNIFMVSLTFADFMVTALVEPLMLVQLYYEAWPFNFASCKFFAYLVIYSMGNSMLTVIFISLQRYVKICHSSAVYEKMFGKYKLEFHLFTTWAGGIFLTILPEFGYGEVAFEQHLKMCSTDPFDFHSWLHMTILMGWALMCLLPVPIEYYLIFRTVRNAHLRIHNHDLQIASTTRPTPRAPTLSKEELRLTKISMLVTFVVMVSWFPMCICYFMLLTVPSAAFALRHCEMLLLVNSSVNPYIYAWMNKHYRTAYKDILGLCVKNNQRDNVQSNSPVHTVEMRMSSVLETRN